MPELLNGLILLPHLRVQNANAISGPLSWGFPPPSAFTGFVHALHRRLGNREITLDGAGIICHGFEPQVYKPNPFNYKFCLARHPLTQKEKTASVIEEGRAHLEVSLLIGVYGYLDEQAGPRFARQAQKAALGMRLAGGSILPAGDGKQNEPRHFTLAEDQESVENEFRKIRRRLLPGFALVSGQEQLEEHLAQIQEQNPEATALDALLDLCCLHIDPIADDPEKPEKVRWQASRSRPGWLVPLPVGYGAISPL
jgi:CRISPR-associated protein Csy2